MTTLPSLTKGQERAKEFIFNNDAVNLFARPGKGKTRIALAAIAATYKRTLVIAPLLPALTAWPDENKKWGFDLDMRVLHGKNKVLGTEDVTVINYEGLPWLLEHDDLSSYDYVVYDEIHKLKNAGSQRFRKLRKYMPNFTYRLGLTGTPVGNRVHDLWGEMYPIDLGESLGRTLTEFRQTYFIPHHYIKNFWVQKDGAEQTIFEKISDYVISLDFEDDEMPELIHNKIPIALSAKARAIYEEMQKTSQVDDTEITAGSAGVRSMKLRQIAAGRAYDNTGEVVEIHDEKQKALVNLVDELQGSPLLVFTQFDHDVTAIKNVIKKVVAIDGRTKPEQMVEIIKRWNRGEIPILVGNVVKIGVGGNLQESGHNACFYTLPWSLGDVEQAIGRIWRQGQESASCVIHYLTCTDTKDDEVFDTIATKKVVQDNIFSQTKKECTQ